MDISHILCRPHSDLSITVKEQSLEPTLGIPRMFALQPIECCDFLLGCPVQEGSEIAALLPEIGYGHQDLLIENSGIYHLFGVAGNRLIQRPAHHARDHPHHARSRLRMRYTAENAPFPILIGGEKRFVVGHIGRSVALLMHIALHDGERFIFDAIAFGGNENRTFIVHHIEGIELRNFGEKFFPCLGEGKFGNPVSAVIMLNINRLRTVELHTGIFWSVGKKIGARANANSSASTGHKLFDALLVFGAQIEVLPTSATSGDNNSVKLIEHIIGNISGCNGANSHLAIQIYRCHRLPDAGLRTSVPLKHPHTHLIGLCTRRRSALDK